MFILYNYNTHGITFNLRLDFERAKVSFLENIIMKNNIEIQSTLKQDLINKELIETSHGSVEKLTLPYLDSHIDPSRINFESGKSLIYKCDVHLMSKFPEKIEQFKGCYIFIKTKDTQELYYIKRDYIKPDSIKLDVESEKVKFDDFKVKIDDFTLFEAKINALKNKDETVLSLGEEQIKEIVTSNGGYTHEDKLEKLETSNGIYSICEKPLGDGGFGKVLLAQEEATGNWIAIKKPHEIPSTKAEIAAIHAEVEELKKSGQLVFFDEKKSAIGIKLLRGHELYKALIRESLDFLSKNQHISLLQKLALMKSAVKSIADLHHDVLHMKGEKEEKTIIFHRDIKSENFFADFETLTARYCDLGVARTISSSNIPVQIFPSIKKMTKEELSEFIKKMTEEEFKKSITDPRSTPGVFKSDKLEGTDLYTAPELYASKDKGEEYEYDEKTEVYALGVVLAEIFDLAVYQPDARYYDFRQKRPSDIPELYNLILSMVDIKKENRPTVVEVVKKLNGILNEVGNVESKALRTCVISIADYLNFNKNEKQKFEEKILESSIHVVVLQGTDKSTEQEYYQARYQLIKSGIIGLAPFMVIGENPNAVFRVVKDHYDTTLPTSNTKVFTYGSKNNRFTDNTKLASQVEIILPADTAYFQNAKEKDKLLEQMLGKVLPFKKSDNSIGSIQLKKFLAKDDTGAVFLGQSANSNSVVKIGKMHEKEIEFLKKINEYYGSAEFQIGEEIVQFHVIKQRGLFNINDLYLEIKQGEREKVPADVILDIMDGCINEILFAHKQGVCLGNIQPKNFTVDNELNVYFVGFENVEPSSKFLIEKDFKLLKDLSQFLVDSCADLVDSEKVKLKGLIDDMIESRGKEITDEQNIQIKENYKKSSITGLSFFTSQESRRTMDLMDKARNYFHRYCIASTFIDDYPEKQLAEEIKKVMSESESEKKTDHMILK